MRLYSDINLLLGKAKAVTGVPPLPSVFAEAFWAQRT